MSPSNSFNPDLVLQTTSLPQPQPQLPTQPGSLPSPPAPPSFNSIGSLASSAHLLRRPSVDPSTSTSQSAPSSNPSLPKLPLPSSNPPLHPLISVRRPSLPITTSPFTSPLLKEEIITSPSPLNHGFRSPTTSNASSTQPAELKIHEPLSSHSHRPNHRSSSPTSYKSTSSFTSSAATHQIPLSSPHGWFSTPKDHSRSSAHVQTPSESHSITPLISHPARSHSYKAPPKRTPDPQLKMSPSMHPGHLASMAISERDAPSDLSPPSRLSDASKAFRTHSGVLEIRLPRHPGPSSRPASSVPWPNVIDDLEEVPEGPFQRPRVVSSIKPTPRHSRAGPRPITQSKASQAPSNTQAPEDLHQHTPPRRQRVYETHPGNLSFCLDGRLVSSRPAQRIDLGWCGTAWIEAYVKLWLKPRLHRAQRKAGRSPSPEGPRDPTPAAPSGSNAREIARNVQRLDQQLSWLMDLQARIKAQCIIHLPLQTIGSFALLIGIGLLFLIKTTHKLIHPSGNEAGASGGGIVLVVVFVYSWTLCFSSMIKTMSSDPGVLPRGLDPSPEMEWKSHGIEPEKKVIGEEEVEMTMDTGEWELLPRWIKIEPKRQDYNTKYTSRSQPDGVPDQDEEGVAWIQCKWCPTCETYRPPRSSHCRACDSCVDGVCHFTRLCHCLSWLVKPKKYLS